MSEATVSGYVVCLLLCKCAEKAPFRKSSHICISLTLYIYYESKHMYTHRQMHTQTNAHAHTHTTTSVLACALSKNNSDYTLKYFYVLYITKLYNHIEDGDGFVVLQC